MKNQKINTIKGFTLIELLVVMGIITLLSSIIMSSLAQAKNVANNTKQIADYRTVIGAMTQFKSSNGYYPALNARADACLGNYKSGGCLNANSTLLPDSQINTELKSYISSYDFNDSPALIAGTVEGLAYNTKYNGFIVKCVDSVNYGLCQRLIIKFPAMKDINSCPTLMSDASANDNFIESESGYTLCSVNLN